MTRRPRRPADEPKGDGDSPSAGSRPCFNYSFLALRAVVIDRIAHPTLFLLLPCVTLREGLLTSPGCRPALPVENDNLEQVRLFEPPGLFELPWNILLRLTVRREEGGLKRQPALGRQQVRSDPTWSLSNIRYLCGCSSKMSQEATC